MSVARGLAAIEEGLPLPDKGLKFTAEGADCLSIGGKITSVPTMFLSSALKVCTDSSANYQA
jgi:hypothetical protein